MEAIDVCVEALHPSVKKSYDLYKHMQNGQHGEMILDAGQLALIIVNGVFKCRSSSLIVDF